MELHTLGVDGGYNQKDVTEVARAFTGWTIASAEAERELRLQAQMHDRGDKLVLDHKISNGGMQDGLKVIEILARHPSHGAFHLDETCSTVRERRSSAVSYRQGRTATYTKNG
jgi:uncharacterized protein (DUF1800 family)